MGACSNNSILFGFVAQGFVVEVCAVAFLYRLRTFEKNGISQKGNFGKVYPFFPRKTRFHSFGEKSSFANACAVQIKHGTNKMSNKNCAKEYGLLTKRIRN